MERDVVCGMQVDPAKAAGKSEVDGKTYYFCSKGCKAKFDANPAHYAKSHQIRAVLTGPEKQRWPRLILTSGDDAELCTCDWERAAAAPC
jgi:YHS domain-containing protein